MAYTKKKRFILHWITPAGKDKYIMFKSKKAAKEFVKAMREQLRLPAEIV